jgi:hypothetical protein
MTGRRRARLGVRAEHSNAANVMKPRNSTEEAGRSEVRDRLRAVHAMSTHRRVVRLAAGLERCQACFDTSVGSLIDPVVLLRPLREGSKIVDFIYEYTNDAACEANVLAREELVGTRMLGRLTQLAPVGLFGAYVAVVETNDPLALDDYAQPEGRGGEPDRRFFDLRALTAGELLVLTWRDVTEPGSTA